MSDPFKFSLRAEASSGSHRARPTPTSTPNTEEQAILDYVATLTDEKLARMATPVSEEKRQWLVDRGFPS
jgi:hypothetical protein